jgi:pimeloyl-ACP methyl ester carboxylesterase
MDAWKTFSCETNGITMHYTRTGGDKPLVILLHGLTAEGTSWTPVARELEKDFDLIMADARGHGLSTAPDQGYSYPDQARDLAGLIASVAMPPVALVGHSMGGMTAALFASLHPTTLGSLVLVDPSFLSAEIQQEVYESGVREQHRKLLGRPVGEIEADLAKRHPGRSREMIRLIARARLRTGAAAFEVLAPPVPDYRELAKRIQVPILLVLADRGVVSPAAAEELQGLNPLVQVSRIRQAGHGIPYDQPGELATVISAFVSSVERRDRHDASPGVLPG